MPHCAYVSVCQSGLAGGDYVYYSVSKCCHRRGLMNRGVFGQEQQK